MRTAELLEGSRKQVSLGVHSGLMCLHRNNRTTLVTVSFAALLASCFVLAGCTIAFEAPRLEDGTISLEGVDLDRAFSLNGQWRFLPGIETDPPMGAPSAIPVAVPTDWLAYELSDGTLERGRGSGTFILEVQDVPNHALGFYTKDQGTAYALYYQDRIDGRYVEPRLILSNGVVSESSEVHQPEYHSRHATFLPRSGEGRIIVAISNFENRTGGFWNPLYFGSSRAIERHADRQLMLTGFGLGVMVFMSLSYLFYYSRRRKEQSSLFLSMFSFVLAVRHLTVERLYAYLFEPGPSAFAFELVARIELISTYALVPIFFFLVYTTYPRETVRLPGYVLAVIAGLASLVTLVTPLRVHSNIAPYFQIVILLCGAYSLFVLITAAIRGRSGARVSVAGFGIFFAAIINDILTAFEIIQTPFLAPYGFLAFLLAQSFQMSVRYSTAIASIEGLNRSLFRFVPQEFIRNLGKESIIDVQLGDAIQREMTILFSDIRSFTALSEQMTPQENFNFLNSYLRRVGPVIRSNGGYIDKYLGDGIMALFPEKPADAVRSSLQILSTLEEYNRHRKSSGYDPIQIGIGIHSGRIILGTVGETERIDGTVIADSVNVASRLEGLNKEFGSSILLSESCFQEVCAEMTLPARLLGLVSVRGKSRPMRVYEAFPASSPKVATVTDFERGVELFVSRRVIDAREVFAELAQKTPEDEAVRRYLKRCESVLV